MNANKMSIDELKAKAERGDAEAQYSLGAAYFVGKRVEQDRTVAAELWRKAAEQGHAKAMHNLCAEYRDGP